MSNDTKPEEQGVEKAKPEPPVAGDGGKGRARRTRGLRTMQRMEDRLTRASRTLAEAFEEGFSTYRDERKKSAEKKRDGALVDFVDNFAAGFADAQEVAAPASKDIITAFSTKRTRKQLRRAARAVSSFFPFVR
jgi:hypothetical protein